MLRAFLSDWYGIIDNLDVLTAVLDGITAADAEVVVRSADLSESTMHCKVYSPKISALAPTFLRNYATRSPTLSLRPNGAESQAIWTGDGGWRLVMEKGIGQGVSRWCSPGSVSPIPRSVITR